MVFVAINGKNSRKIQLKMSHKIKVGGGVVEKRCRESTFRNIFPFVKIVQRKKGYKDYLRKLPY